MKVNQRGEITVCSCSFSHPSKWVEGGSRPVGLRGNRSDDRRKWIRWCWSLLSFLTETSRGLNVSINTQASTELIHLINHELYYLSTMTGANKSPLMNYRHLMRPTAETEICSTHLHDIECQICDYFGGWRTVCCTQVQRKSSITVHCVQFPCSIHF